MKQGLHVTLLGLVFVILSMSGAAAEQAAPATRPSLPSQQIVFVCDASDSMVGRKIDTVGRELINTIKGLRSSQSFSVIFMRDNTCAKLSDVLLTATAENKQRAEKFIDDFKPGGKTEPMPALETTFKMQPNLVYLLCDRDMPNMDGLPARIVELNHGHRAKVNTIAFVGDADKDTEFLKVLQRIAKENDGVYKFVKESDL